jgi:hypothetical protein
VGLGDHLAHLRFHDGTLARIHGLDLCRTQIDANKVIALVGETGGGNTANISQAEYANGATHAIRHISSESILGIQVKDRTSQPGFTKREIVSVNLLFSATSHTSGLDLKNAEARHPPSTTEGLLIV